MPSLQEFSRGWPQLTTEVEDHVNLTKDDVRGCCGKAFQVDVKSLPADIRTTFADMNLSKARKAGTISNQKSAAATAWLLHNASSDFTTAGRSWTGILVLCKRACIKN